MQEEIEQKTSKWNLNIWRTKDISEKWLIKPTAIIIATAVMAAISLPRLPLMSIYGKLLNEPNRRNKMKLRASGEDYLEAVLMLQKKNGMVRSIDLAGTWRFPNPASAEP